MIVCKIMAEFNSPDGDFEGLFRSLAQYGAVLCPGDAVFFASSLDQIDKKKVKKALKKHGYDDSVIIEYGVGNPPRETPDINGWIFDFITKNAVVRLGRENQEAIMDGMLQLSEIDAQITEKLTSLPDEPSMPQGAETDTEE